MQNLVPRYTLIEEVHLGNDTLLYRGKRNDDGASVVIKFPRIAPPRARDIARLRHEYSILSGLDLPGVVRAYALEPCERGCALILEHITGQPLSHVLRAGRLDLTATLEIALSLSGALGGLHDRGIIHKDVQPHNILVTAAGDARLVDFGIAARISQEVQMTVQPDALEGTLAYMSPEQTGRMNRVIDHRTDMYSLGVTLYQMLAGELPFLTTEPTELVHSHLARIPTPLHERIPGLPAVVSQIIAKLLAKAAEDRYSTARGLENDIATCLEQLRSSSSIPTFTLGRHDVSNELRIPQKLYGRATEIADLLAAFERAGHGAAELLLVSGFSGVGKSALVHEIHKPIARRGGYFVSGKFDQYSRSVPYAPIARAFRDLMRQILSEPAQALEAWKTAITAAVEQNGQLLIDLVPELELVIGPQPPVQELGPSESQNRFSLLFQRFLRVFCRSESTLVIFLDDLQWVDPASLKMLQGFLTAGDHSHLLIIGAYRDNEVGSAHPLSLAVSELREAGAPIREIKVVPLSLAHISHLLTDALGRSHAEIQPLARLIQEKTHGNPFFLGQLLQLLHKDGHITLDVASGTFHYDMTSIGKAAVTDNVVEFMVSKLQRLAAPTQQVLKLAACIGHSFDLRTLAVIHERPQKETAEALWEALAEGIMQPLDSDYRLVHGPSERGGPSSSVPSPELPVSYRFLHDRVQQAAYMLIDGGQEQHVHLKIGRLMLAGADASALEEQIFDVAGHLNRGALLIQDPDERLALARLNLSAGVKAKVSTAYESASEYIAAGIAMLPPACFDEHYDLAFALHIEQAQCEELAVRKDLAETLLDELLPHARTRLDRTRVQTLRTVHFTAQARYQDALDAARDALELFGIPIPAGQERWAQAFEAELARIEGKLAGRRPADLLDLPAMRDPELSALIRLLVYVSPCAFFTHKMLIALVSAMQVRLSLENGNSESSSYGYVFFGIAISDLYSRYAEGYQYGLLALDLNEKMRNAELTGRVYELVNAHLAFFVKHLRVTIEGLEKGYRAALSAGDLAYVAYITYQISIARFGLGEELGAIHEMEDRYLAVTSQMRDRMSMAFHRVIRQSVACLMGRTKGRFTLSDDSFDEEAFIASLDRNGIELPSCWYHVTKAKILFIQERYPEAYAMARGADERSATSMALYHTTPLPFYACLIRLALYPSASPEERARYDAEIETDRARIALWAENCPENFRYRLQLIDAERARVAGQADAVGLYEQAIDGARANEYTQHEALANELCAKFYRGRGNRQVASLYMTAARAAYARWGAAAKVAQIDEVYPDLVVQQAASSMESVTTTRQQISSELFDVTAVVRAAHVIAGELVVDRVVDRLLRLAVTNAGAQRAVLLLLREGRLVVVAAMTVEPEVVTVGLAEPAAGRADLPRSLLDYVVRTGESVVLGEATNDTRFGADLALASPTPRSVLCMPLVHQTRLGGVLYLENVAASDVFVPARVEVLGLLSAQAAISIENATLYDELDQRVKARTRELEEAQRRLIDTAHSAGMAEIATNVLHNVGNVLNSITVSAAILAEQLDGSCAPVLGDVAKLIRERRGDLASFLRDDPRGQQIPDFVEAFAGEIDAERRNSLVEVARLNHHVNHVREIVTLQQSFAGGPCLIEEVSMIELMENALRISGAVPERFEIEIVREYAEFSAPCQLQRHIVLQILVNLLTNAVQGLRDVDGGLPRRLVLRLKPEDGERVRIEVADSGKGILPENLPRIFTFGFTTRPGGHGFGLHFCAVNTKAMGGELCAHSAGPGKGATFTLVLPQRACAGDPEVRA